MKPGSYLAGIADARALFIYLYEDAIRALPPPTDTDQHDLIGRTSLKAVAGALGVSRNTVSRDLDKLILWGWVRDRKVRYLGRRVGRAVYLMADLEAERHTEQKNVVSKIVLKIRPRKEKKSSRRLGTMRKWEKDDGSWPGGYSS